MSVCQSSTTLAMLCEVNSAEHQPECEDVRFASNSPGSWVRNSVPRIRRRSSKVKISHIKDGASAGIAGEQPQYTVPGRRDRDG